MKTINIATFIMLLLSVCISCNNKTSQKIDGGDNNEKSVEIIKEQNTKKPMAEDCHGVRKVIQTKENEEGLIMKVGEYYLITQNDGNKRYKVCELSDNFKKDGMPVFFSGDILEIFPNERLMGTPFRLKAIKKNK